MSTYTIIIINIVTFDNDKTKKILQEICQI